MLEHIFLSVISTSLSVGLVIILLTVLTPLIDRRYTAKWKYLVWILLALRLVIPIDPVNTQNFIQNLKVETAVEEMHSAEKPLTPVPQQPRLSRRIVLEIPSGMNEPMTQSDENIQITPLMFLIGIWLTGSAIFVCIHLYSYLRYRRLLKRDGTRIKNQRLLKLLQELSDELHLTQKVSIVKYAVADSPMMIGFLRPVLVLPTETYSDEALYYILKHEMVHFMRHDVYWKLLFVLANAIHCLIRQYGSYIKKRSLTWNYPVMSELFYGPIIRAKLHIQKRFTLCFIRNTHKNILYPRSFMEGNA